MADDEREHDEPLNATAGTDLEGSRAGEGADVVGTPGWAAQSGAAALEGERARGKPADPGAGGESGPNATPPYGSSGQEGQGAPAADRPPGGNG